MTATASDGAAELTRRLSWAEQGSEAFLSQMALVSDDSFRAPSKLPGWTYAHIVAHVAHNAKGISNLVNWARTGVETPMYPSREVRDAEIEQSSTLEPSRLREFASQSDQHLRAGFAAMGAEEWSAEVVTAQGRKVAATELPWMRAREVWIHGVDLDAGLTFDDFPESMIDALIGDIAGQRERQGEFALLIAPTDRERSWTMKAEGKTPLTVRGSAADLSRWLAGRGDAGVEADGPIPGIGGWL